MKTGLKELIMKNIVNESKGFRALRSHLQGLPLHSLSKRAKRRMGVFTLSVVTIITFAFVLAPKQTEAGWWDETWLYRIKETFTNSASAIANYQVSITLDTATLITASKMQSDCDDVRVTDIGGKELPYWIEESGVGGCNSTTTKIWTKLPMLYAGKTDIYLYYGNSQTASGANGNEVFEQFDTFSGTTLDGTKWSSTGTPEVTSGSLKLESSDAVVSTTTKTDANGLGQIIYRAKQAITNLTAGKIGFSNTNNLSTHYNNDDVAVNQIGSTEETVNSIGSTNLVSHYQLEETTITDANQFKASGYFDTGKLNQGISIYGNSAGTLGSTLTFQRGAQISSANYEHINTRQGTISFWIKPSWNGNDNLNHQLLSDPNGGIQIIKNSSNSLFFYLWDTGTSSYKSASVTASTWSSGSWYQIIVRWDADNVVAGSNYIELYVNGSNAGVTNGTTAFTTVYGVSYTLSIGSRTDGTYPAQALIDDFAIYDRVLTTAEIASLYNSGTGNEAGYVADSSLKFYAKLDGSGTLSPVTYNLGSSSSKLQVASSELTGGTNKLLNGNMQVDGNSDGRADNWSANAGGATFSAAETANILFDSRSQKISATVVNDGIVQDISVTAGENYYLSAWVKSDGTNDISVRIYDLNNGAYIDGTGPLPYLTTNSANWIERTKSFKVPAGCSSIRVWIISNVTATFSFYVGRITITPQLVDNGGMEGALSSEAPSGWVEAWNYGTGSAETSTQHSGSQAFKYTHDASASSGGIRMSSAMTIDDNLWYLISFWGKADSAFSLVGSLNGGEAGALSVALSTAWQKFTYIKLGSNFNGNAGVADKLAFYTGNANKVFYLDDISVIPLDNVATSFKSWTPVADSPGDNSTERALNPGFEIHTGTEDDGVTDTFTSWNQETGTNGIVDATTSMHNGLKAVKMYNSSTSLRPVIYQNLSGLTIGQTYKFSVWNQQAGGATAYLRLIENAGAGANLVVVTLSGNTGYTQYSTYFTPTTSNPQIALYHNSTTTGTVYWDDVSVKEVPNPLSVQGDSDGVVSTTSGARGNAYTFDGSTGYLRQKTYDVNVGTLTYQDTNTDISDDGQEFEDWDNDNAGSAEYMIVITNSDNTTSWGYFCANDGGTQTAVYTLKACTGGAEGFNGTSPSGKTPVGYEIRKTDYQITGDLTIGAWVKRSAIGYADAVVSKFGSNSANSSYLLRLETNNTIMLNTNNSAAIYSDTTITSTTDWYFIVGTLSGTTGNIYINGLLNKTGTINNPRNDSLSAITVGAASSCNATGIPCWYFHGSIDSPFVISSVLTADQIKDIYNSTASHYGLVSNNATVNSVPANSSSPVVDANTYHTYTIANTSTSSVLTQDGTTIATSTTNLPNSAMYLRAQNSSASSIYIDWIATTKQLATQPTSSPATEEKSPAPVGYWKLDEGTGSEVKDSSGSGLSGTITGATWQTEDMCMSGKCLIFDGTNDYVNLAQNSNYAYQNGDTWTVGAWFKTTSSITGVNGGKVIVSKGTGNAIAGYALVIGQLNSQGYDNKLGFVIDKSPGNNLVISASGLPTINDNKWHYAAVVFDAANNTNVTGTIYLDGKSYGSQTSAVARSGWASTTSYPMRVGTAGIANSEFFPGFVDEVKIYPYARTTAQIKADYNSRGTIAAAAVVIQSDSEGSSLSNGLVGYWKMDENTGTTIVDSSGNYGLATFGASLPTWVVGKFGSAIQHDGANTFASTPNSTVLNISGTQISYGAWVYVTAYPATYGIIMQKGSNPGYRIMMRSNGLVQSQIAGQSSYSASALPQSVWNHVFVTYDGTSIKIYINGVLQNNPTAYTGTIGDNSGSILYFGTTEYPTFTGKEDEVRIYNRALSAAEVRALYDWSPGPVAHWKMDEGTGQSANDISGNNNTGTLGANSSPGSDDPTWANGKYGKALSFDGSNDYVKTSSIVTTAINNITLSAWIKWNGNTGSNQRVISNGVSPTNGYDLFLNSTDGNNIQVVANGVEFAKSTITPTVGQWQYVSAVRDAGTWKIYLNGVILTVIGNPTPNSPTGATYIGSNSNGATNFNGFIDDVRIYNYARTQKQIVQDMNAGHPAGGSPVGSQTAYWKFNEGSGPIASSSVWTQAGTTTNLIANPSFETGTSSWSNGNNAPISRTTTKNYYGNAALQVDYTDQGWVTNYVSLSPSTTYTFTYWANGSGNLYANFYSTETGDLPGTIITLESTSWKQLTKTFTTGVTVTNAQIQIRKSTSGASTVYADGAQLTQTTSALIYCDGSIVGNGTHSWNGTAHASTSTCTYGQDGEINGATWTSDGKFDKALSFDGTNDYVNLGHATSFDITGAISLGAWVKPDTTKYWGVIVSKRTSNNYSGITYELRQNYADLWFNLSSGSGWVCNLITTSSPLSNGVWKHVVGVYDGSSCAIYVNGVVILSAPGSGSTTTNVGDLVIGTYLTAPGQYFKGNIDEVKIYPYALTSDEALIDYNRGLTVVMGSTGTSSTGSADNSDTREYCPPGNVEGNCANGLNPAPVAEWNFEEGSGNTVKDTSGNGNNGAITGATYKTGKVGSALSFVGASSNLVNIGDTASVDFTGSFTISSWLKTSTSGAIGAFVSKWGNSNGAKQYNLSINDDNTILFAVMHSGASFSWMLSNATVTDNSWHHVEAINDDTTNKLYIYIDGKLDNSVTRTSANSLQNTTTPLRLGEQGDGNGAYYTGFLDNVKLYSYTRTTAQIAYDYNRGAPIGWWKLNECQGTTANDSSGNNNVGTITIGATVPQTSAGTCGSGVATEAWNNGTNGKFNGSLNFDGVDDYVTSSNFSNDFNFNGPFAIAFWFKQDALTGDKTMISNWRMANIGGVTNHGMFIERNSVANKTLRFVYRNNGVGVFDFYIGNIYQENQWNYVVAVYDPSLPSANAKIYLNGVLGDTTANANTTFAITGRSLLIGSLDGGADSYGRYFNGQIDDVRIYNYALTAEQVKTVMNEGSVVRY